MIPKMVAHWPKSKDDTHKPEGLRVGCFDCKQPPRTPKDCGGEFCMGSTAHFLVKCKSVLLFWSFTLI